MSPLATQPLRDEHQELLPQVDLLRTLGDAADAPGRAVGERLDAALDFLEGHLLIHAQAEEDVLYPAVGRLMGAPLATATMSRDHAEVHRFVEQLAAIQRAWRDHAPSASEVNEVRRLAYGLHALVVLHFAKEEEIYLPLIDEGLTEAEARQLFESMEQAAGEARHAH